MKQDSKPVMSNTVDKHTPITVLKEQMEQSLRLYEAQNNTIIKLQERNRVLVEALGELYLVDRINPFATQQAEVKAYKALQSNQ